jgi:Mg-chelatase subunit ChlD
MASAHAMTRGQPPFVRLRRVRQVASALFAAALTLPAAAEDRRELGDQWDRQVEVEFIVDGSGSMAGRVGGQTKISGAKQALGAILGGIPDSIAGADIGLRVYGHRSPRAQKNCKDTKLEVPLRGVSRDAFQRVLGSVSPTGHTPIAYSLEAAAGDFKKDGDRIVVLITDGIESCDGDPCATSERLVAAGAFQKPYVVGFAVNEEEKAKLSCIGHYVDARSAEDLQKLLDEIIQKAVIAARVEVKATFNGRAIPPASFSAAVRTPEGALKTLASARAVRVPPGSYEVEVSQRVDRRCGPITAPVTVGEGGVTRVVAAFGRGEVKFDIPGGEPHGNDLRMTDLEVYPAGKMGKEKPMLKGKAIQTAELCAGKYDLRFAHPKKGESAVEAFEVKAQSKVTVPIRF